MFEEIRIENLGVIAAARLPLGPGLTAITGETGAGKTMVLTGLGLLLGAKADASTVRIDKHVCEILQKRLQSVYCDINIFSKLCDYFECLPPEV